ncbi:MAG: TolC family protein, partial [bacterium]
ARRQLEQAKSELTSARSDNYPQVRGFASAARTRTENSGATDGTGNDISLGIAVSWNAFDAGLTNAKVEEAAARIAERRRTLAELTTKISAEVRSQHEQLDAALIQLELSEKILDMTREIRDIVTRKYSVGQVTITRLNQTQTDLVRAESQHAAAGIRVRLAQQNLDAATGRLTVDRQP